MAKQDDWARITLRLPGRLHDQLTGAIADKAQSLNAEIVERLQASFVGQAFVAHANRAEDELLRRAAAEAEAIVRDMDTVLGPIDSDAWRAGAYSYLEEPIGKRSTNPYAADTPQHASWLAGRAFAVAAELKKAVRQAQGLPDDQTVEG